MEEKRNDLGLYIHIPFCRSKCAYCDFYSLPHREEAMDNYRAALSARLSQLAPQAANRRVDTVYFGGGTPSYFGAKRLAALLTQVRSLYRLAPDAEITLEANPDSADEVALSLLRQSGFNRLSLGVQSVDDALLKRIGRPHTFAQARRAVSDARRADFANVSLDLIYGLPGQDLSGWQSTLERVLALEPDHLSCYGLKVEEGTPLHARVLAGEQLPDDDAQVDMYLWAVERLEGAGFVQYEISNFARPGFASRHNLRYWQLRPYLGFGPGAHSDFNGRRFSLARDLERCLSGEWVRDTEEAISPRERASEYLMLGLRTARGVEKEEYQKICGGDFAPIEECLTLFARHGWARRTGERWRLTPEGFLLSNQLIGRVLEAQDSA